MELKRKIKFLLVFCMIFCMPTLVYAQTEYKIEQVFVNMPDVTAYYRSPDAENQLEAYIGGESLQMITNQRFSETEEAVEYYVLLDISASIKNDRFEDIKTSLSQFDKEIRLKDRMILTTFGDAVTTVLDGTKKGADADAVIQQLQNRDQNTLFFEAIDSVIEMIRNAAAKETMRRVVIVISDGKDCSDNTRSMESVEDSLSDNGIPIYTIAVENNEGDSEAAIADYQGKFSALARNTGGLPWTMTKEHPQTWEAFENIQKTVLDSFRAQFKAVSNKISNKTEEFVLKFISAGEKTDTYRVMMARNQKDEEAPDVSVEKGKQYNELVITYSEPVENAEKTSSYVVESKEKKIPVKQITRNNEVAYSYILVFDNDFKNGTYTIKISDVTDSSNEKNALAKTELSLEIKDAPEENPLEKIWPFLVAGVVIFVMILVIIIKIISGKKTEVSTEKTKETEKASEKVVGIQSKKDNETVVVIPETQKNVKDIVIWMSSGGAQPTKLEYQIHGSAIVGRSSSSDIECADPHMSRQHFILIVEENQLFVEDLQTVNGTLVNDIKINGRYKLTSSDKISAGSINFRIDW